MALEKTRGRRISVGETAVVVGAGRSGLAAARLLCREGAQVRLLDSNADAFSGREALAGELRQLGISIELGPHKPDQFENAAFVVPSPGMPVARLAGLVDGERAEILAEMELAWRYLENEPVLAVTGTSGKTTTASLAAAMLHEQGYAVFLGGNIGTPLSEYVLSGHKADVLVLEISSFQLQTCSTFCPRAGILLNITPNHLDYHKDMAEYTEAKFRLFRCQDEGDLAVFGESLRSLAARYGLKARQVYVSDAGRFSGSSLMGAHNRVNEEAAWQACRLFGVSEENAARALARFAPLPHRLERVRELEGVLFVNDSKCTTVSSLKVALEAFDRPVRLVCGGKFKGGDLAGLADLVKNRVSAVALFGAGREHFERAWQGLVPMTWHASLEPAVKHLAASACRGDVVLMAPATSSFDLYANYEERGKDFKRIVGKLS
ncbi:MULTISPECIES: UDP-N-acetylmuramoyl-L-alanine--D-glutamate ligase [Desulfovibrio]|uniref:UDP-N-acetylmuramoylalanine--D-glutamate ligase n=1 Tax=Desulfovibrio desulfuricans TaxID=876 RepID=A0AA94HR16_DESDE|nr:MULTISPECIES: UDP-N-acetylmuramoyl-L-alanine--D-glutamate ligase [Desulfovibrio]ATD81104.1 UDP-N-acetylmuramoyl-L-alanine--D-glutamate ligase [Desulfovibrio sp. G11]SFW23847.1 UDP-N-acetylmuramoylalanine--D-glutamate ligase [Desulfovibrio desulfuricans]SPD36715.1 UDP-N-acetylmuramoyl-L-alanine-D-glutamate ligase [Desulfovibrio sp. G11]